MGVTESRVLSFKIGQQGFGHLIFAQISAQDGIDKTGLGTVPGLPGLLDGLVDGGVRGDAVEPENLVKAEPQEILQVAVLLAAFCFAGDKPIQGQLPARHAIDQFLAEMPIRRGK